MIVVKQAIPAVWVYTTNPGFNAPRGDGYASFLTDGQKARLERIRQARMLFDGQHREYFLAEGRTQFEFPLVRASDATRSMANPQGMVKLYLRYNVLQLISLKGADLLFGQPPLLRVDDEVQQGKLADLEQRSNLHALLYGCAVDCSYEAETFLESCVYQGEAYLKQVPADEIFPEGDLMPDGQYRSYVRYALQNYGTSDNPIWLVLITRYLPGSITRNLYQLDDKGNRAEVDLSNWAVPDGAPPLAGVTATRVPDCTITWIPNLLVRGKPVSDYDGVIDLQDALNAKNSQVARVLLKHSDPKMAFPAEAFDDDGNVRSDYDAFPFSEPDAVPKYITWDGHLDAAMQDRAFYLNQILVATETSPVLLGLKEGAAPDAYKKVRLESFNSISKAQRKASFWKAGVARAVRVTQALENTIPGTRYDQLPIGVEFRDGIPADDLDLAQVISLTRSAKSMSLERSVELQIPDAAAQEKEIALLKKEQAEDQAMAALMAPPMAGGQEATTDGAAAGTEEADAQSTETNAGDGAQGVAA